MIPLGKQKAKIVNVSLGMNDNGNPYVSVLLRPAGGEEVCLSKIYVTANALFFAAKRLAVCGFDIKAHTLEEIETDEGVRGTMIGNEVEIDVIEDTYNGHNFQKVDIILPLPKVDKVQLSALSKSMREAVSKEERKVVAKAETPKKPLSAPADRMKAPAVQHIPLAERARLDKQAEEEGIGF